MSAKTASTKNGSNTSDADPFLNLVMEAVGSIHYSVPQDNRALQRCTAGLVRVDLNLSHTIGETLDRSVSVKEFLKAMYDLVEVHRMLVEEHGILHRDISWPNILINAIHLDNNPPDDLCGRPFIDVILGVQKDKQKPHITLTNFASGLLIDKHSALEEEVAGTPAFMSRSLCGVYARKRDIIDSKFLLAFNAIYSKYPSDVFQDEGRSKEVSDFLQVAKRLDDTKQRLVELAGPEKRRVVHAPVHDAESIFWIMVLFFLRACPKGYDRTDPSEEGRRKARTRLFRQMMTKKIGDRSAREIPKAEAFPPVFGRFVEMLRNLDVYFNQAWYYLPENCAHRFHGHNALQSLLLEAIGMLKGGDILLDKKFLDVDFATSCSCSECLSDFYTPSIH